MRIRRLGIRPKIALLWSFGSLAVAAAVGLLVNATSGRLYTRQFLANKLSMVTTIAAAIDGDAHVRFAGGDAVFDPAYQRLLAALGAVKRREEHLTYLYTLNLGADGALRYAVDSDISPTDIVWVESDSFAFWISFRDGRLAIDTEQEEGRQALSLEAREGVRLPLEVRGGAGEPSVWLGDQQLMRVLTREPLAVETAAGVVDTGHRELGLEVLLAGERTPLVVSFSGSGESTSTPGSLYVDTPGNTDMLVRAVRDGRDFVEQEPEQDNYGLSQSAYGIIRGGSGDPVGVVAADFYQDELRAFRLQMQHTVALVAVIAFGISLAISLALTQYLLVPLAHLAAAVRRVGEGSLDVRIPGRRTDELGDLARGFNSMVESLAGSLARRQEAEAELVRLAHSDQLTGLPNRKSFHDRLEESIAAAGRSETEKLRGLLFLDLDHFKEVNDTRGHQAGDTVLGKAAALIRRSVRQSDLVFRLGGDEFTVLLTILRSEEDAGIVARKLVQAFAEPIDADGGPVLLGMSVGIALYPRDGTTVDELVHSADTALLEAKRERCTFRYYRRDARQLPRS